MIIFVDKVSIVITDIIFFFSPGTVSYLPLLADANCEAIPNECLKYLHEEALCVVCRI